MRLKVLFAILFGLIGVSTYAQFKASIQGTILDTGGGVVVGATVTVVEVETGLTRETQTTAEGYYRVGELPPGKYTVTVAATGFRKSVIDNVLVEAEMPRGVDVTLAIGAVSEQVTVSAAAATLQTEDASVSSTISSEQIERLPQFGRDPYELLKLAPGVFGDGARASNGSAANLPNSGGPGGSNVIHLPNGKSGASNRQRPAQQRQQLHD